jgi:hypothetical protein
MEEPGIPYDILVLVIIVMPLTVTFLLTLFLRKNVVNFAYHCSRCDALFRRKAHLRFPDVCPRCHARDWNRVS